MNKKMTDGISWENATNEGHERQQLQLLMRLSFVEKLDWLEEAQILAELLQKQTKLNQPRNSIS